MKVFSTLAMIGVMFLCIASTRQFECIDNPTYAEGTSTIDSSDTNNLAVLWTSGDPEVALKVCFMYTSGAKKYEFFKEVVLIVWGPSSKLLTENTELQEKVKQMIQQGIVIEACVACADSYGVSDELREMGIDVKSMGTVLTQYLKDENWNVLTF